MGTEEYPGNALQRVQMIKGWYEDGELFEEVIDIAGGENDASVDINSCEQSGSRHSQLCTLDVSEHDVHALLAKCFSEIQADTSRAAADDGGLSGKTAHGVGISVFRLCDNRAGAPVRRARCRAAAPG